MPPTRTWDCFVCNNQEPANYTLGGKRTRLLTWLHYHASNGIEHVEVWGANPTAGVLAEGKERLSKTIGWDIREEHGLMANTRNEYGGISQRNFGQIWRLEFDYQGALYFTNNAQVLFDIGRIYTPDAAKRGVRIRQQSEAMSLNAGSTQLTEFLGLLEQEATVQGDPDLHILRSGMALYDKVMSDGGYPTWTRARIWGEVTRLPNLDPAKYATVQVSTLLGDMAGCP